MSNPTEPTPPHPEDAQPTEAYPTDAQPTDAFPTDAQPTEAYPTEAYPTDSQPTEAYPPTAQPGDPAAYAQPAYGVPAYGAPAYGSPPYGAPGYGPASDPSAPSAADRPRGLGWASLGLAIGGLVLVGAAFIPLLWVSVALALIGGFLLLAALVLGIVTLVSRKQGGKGLGIAAIALSVLGGIVWVFALTWAIVLIGLTAAGSSDSAPEPEVSVSQEAEPDEEEPTDEETPAGTYDEAAYLDAVRPEITAILQELDPNFSEDLLDQIYSDEMLLATGKALLLAGDAGREAFVSSTVASSDGALTEEQAIRFYDAVLGAAEQHLVE